jgi:hypothetical protein
MSKFIALGAVLAMLAVTALTLKLTQPKVTLPRAAVAAPPVQPIDPAILHTHFQKLRTEGALP